MHSRMKGKGISIADFLHEGIRASAFQATNMNTIVTATAG